MQAATITGTGSIPLVLVHGLSSCKETWKSVVTHKAIFSTFRTLAIDLIGYGSEPRDIGEDISLPIQIQALKSAVDKVGEGKPVVLIGHSMGTRVTIPFAAKYPSLVSHLVIEDMDVRPRDRELPSEEQIAKFPLFTREADSKEEMIQKLDEFGMPPARTARWFEQGRVRQREADGKWITFWHPWVDYQLYLHLLFTDDARKIAPTVHENKTKTLIMFAGRGSVAIREGQEEMKQIFPDAKVVTIYKADHSIHTSAPKQFLQELFAFLELPLPK